MNYMQGLYEQAGDFDWIALNELMSRLSYLEGIASKESSLTDWIVAITSCGALFLSAIAVALVYRTLQATRKTIDEARRANETAEKAISASEKIGRAQIRAYFSVHDVKAFIKKGVTEFQFCYTNVGVSPARKMTVRATGSVNIGLGRSANRISRNVSIQYPADAMPNRALEYKADGGLGALNPTEISAIEGTASALELFVSIEYHDVFGDKQKDEFQFISLSKPGDNFETLTEMRPPPIS